MYNLQDAYEEVTMAEVLSKVSQMELWKYYCSNFEKVDTFFKSEFYNDSNPSCRITSKGTRLYYTDYGTGQYFGNALDYVQFKYNCTLRECLRIVANDFGLKKLNLKVRPDINLKNLHEKLLIKPKADIQIITQPFNLVDYNYWGKFKLSFDDLESDEVTAAKYVFLTNQRGELRYEYTNKNPIYAYKEYDIDCNFLGYRIYMPLASKGRKWFNNTTNTAVQGIKGLAKKGKLLIITKSLKDVMVLRKMGYNAISLASETTSLSKEIYEKLIKRFDKIISLYDNDESGIKGAKSLADLYGIKAYFIPLETNCKDVSDLVDSLDLKEGKRIVKKLINE